MGLWLVVCVSSLGVVILFCSPIVCITYLLYKVQNVFGILNSFGILKVIGAFSQDGMDLLQLLHGSGCIHPEFLHQNPDRDEAPCPHPPGGGPRRQPRPTIR